MNIPSCTPVDTRGIFALLWWYTSLQEYLYPLIQRNLFRKPHSSSLWHTLARTHAIVKVYMGPRLCRIRLKHETACTCSTFHFNSSTLYAYEVICHGFDVCWFFFSKSFFCCCFFLVFSLGNISRVSSSLDPDHARRVWSGSKLFAKVISRRH